MPHYKQGEEFYSEMKKAKGMGSAKSGAHHWLHQRITSVAQLFLVPWALWAVHANILGASFDEVVAWIGQPLNAILAILLVVSVHYHAVLGLQVVVEDYIHKEWFKMLKLIGQRLFYFASAVACIYGVIFIALQAAS